MSTIIAALPMAAMGSAIPTTGGQYRYSSRLLSPKVGFFWLLLFIVTQLPKKYPKLYKKAPFKLKPKMLNFIVVLAVLLLGCQGYLLLSSLTYNYILGTIAYIAAAALYVIIAGNRRNIKTDQSLGFSADSDSHIAS